jgi:hypothetical protein
MSSNLFYNRILDVLIKNIDNDLTLEKIGKIITRFTLDKEDYAKSEELSLKIFLEYFNKYKDFIDTKCFLPTTSIEISKEEVAYLIKSIIDEYDNKNNKEFFEKTIKESSDIKEEKEQKKLVSIIKNVCIEGVKSLDYDDTNLHKENIELVNQIISLIFDTGDLKTSSDIYDNEHKMSLYLKSLQSVRGAVSSSLGKLIEFGILRDFIDGDYLILNYDLEDLSRNEAYSKLETHMQNNKAVIHLLEKRVDFDTTENVMSLIDFYDMIIIKDKNYATLFSEKTNNNQLIQILENNFNISNYEFTTKASIVNESGEVNELVKEYKSTDTLKIYDEDNKVIDVSRIEQIKFLELKKSLILPEAGNNIFDFYIPAKVQYKNTGEAEHKSGIIKEFLALESKFSKSKYVTQDKLTSHKTDALITKNSQVIYAIETVNKSGNASLKDIKNDKISVDISFKSFYIKDLAANSGYYKTTKEIDDSSLTTNETINIENFTRSRFTNYYLFIGACLNLKMGNIYSNLIDYLKRNKLYNPDKTNKSLYIYNNNSIAYEYFSPNNISDFLVSVNDDLFEKVNNIKFGSELEYIPFKGVTNFVSASRIFNFDGNIGKTLSIHTALGIAYVKGSISADGLIDAISESIPISIDSTDCVRSTFFINTCIYYFGKILKFIKFIECINANLADDSFIHRNEFLSDAFTDELIEEVKSILDDLSSSHSNINYNIDTDTRFLDAIFIKNAKLRWHADNISNLKMLSIKFNTGDIYNGNDYNYEEQEKRRLENKGPLVNYDMLIAIRKHIKKNIYDILLNSDLINGINNEEFVQPFVNLVKTNYESEGYEGINRLAKDYISNREATIKHILDQFNIDIKHATKRTKNGLFYNPNAALNKFKDHDAATSDP